MTVSGMNSQSASTLFSGLSSGGGLYSSLSDYNSIRSGSYGKLLSSYYNQTGSQSVSSNNAKSSVANDHTSRGYRERYLREQEMKNNASSSSQSSSAVTAQNSNAKVASGANSMVSSIDKLNESDTFKTGADGNYNVNDIYKAVKSYVDSYNDVIDASKKTNVSGVSSNVSSMTNVSNMYSDSLAKIGITIGDDKKLNLDETMFKQSDMSKVKETFGRSNYGYSIRTNAYMANYYAKQAQNSSTTYGSNGSYSLADVMSSYQSFI